MRYARIVVSTIFGLCAHQAGAVEQTCDRLLQIAVRTDSHPQDTTWEIRNACTDDSNNEVVVRGGPYDEENTHYKRKACLSSGKYDFIIYDKSNNGMSIDGGYSLKFNGCFGGAGTNFGTSDSQTDITTRCNLVGSCPNPCGGLNVELFLTTDGYPAETTWEIRNSSGETVVSGGPYDDEMEMTFFHVQECLDLDEYEFTIYDSWGDGISCPSEGYDCGYTLKVDGIVKKTGGSVGDSETDSETTTFGSSPEPVPKTVPAATPDLDTYFPTTLEPTDTPAPVPATSPAVDEEPTLGSVLEKFF